MSHRHTIHRVTSHVQQYFDFAHAMIETPELSIDHPRFEPNENDLVAVDGFLLHPVHAERLLQLREKKASEPLESYLNDDFFDTWNDDD